MQRTLAIVPFLSAIALAQTPPDQAPSSLAPALVPIHSGEADPIGGAYGTWAAGPGYKVSFHDGMTFIPLLGDRVTTNRTLSWRTESVRVGATQMMTDHDANARRASDYRFEYDYGRFVEAYDVRTDGLEQTFVFSERPAVAGDLIITGTLSGNLTTTERAASHSALKFTGPDRIADVTYGRAVAIDARGDTALMTTAVHGGRIELRLDAAFLESAAYPLVVDPLLSVRNLGLHTGLSDVDVYRDDDHALSNVWLVYSQQASASDTDLLIRRYPDDLSGPGVTVFSDLNASWDTKHGQIAGVHRKVVTVFERDFRTGSYRVRWHTHLKNDVSVQTNVSSVPYVSSTNEWRPDIGGTESSSSNTIALLVYQREPGSSFSNTNSSDVFGLRIDTATSNGTPIGSEFDIGGFSNIGDEERPAVNQVEGGNGTFSWLVTFQYHTNLPGADWSILGQRVRSNSGPYGSTHYIGNLGPDFHAVAPRIAGTDGRYLLTFGAHRTTAQKPAGILSERILARRIDWSLSANSPSYPHPTALLEIDGGNYLVPGDCAFDLDTRSHWVVLHARDLFNQQRLCATKVGYNGRVVEHTEPYVVPGFQPLPGGVSYDQDNERFVLAFPVETGLSTNTLWGTHVTYENVVPPGFAGAGCHPRADLQWVGDQKIGSEHNRIEVVQAPPLIGSFLIASLGPDSVPLAGYGMPGCTLVVDAATPRFLFSLFRFTNTAGIGRLPLPLPPGLTPLDLHFQWFLLETGVNPAGARATNGLRVPIGL
ncbi:MAG: hypothetical protein NXI31_15995 [bacterium]|nr:hypothetical protein [bacterium]